MLIIKMASMLESIAIDVYSFPTSKLAVNAALFAVVIIVTYTVFSWLVKALILAAKQEWTYRDVCAEPAPSLVHGHVPYVCALPTCGILCLFVFVVISYEGTSLCYIGVDFLRGNSSKTICLSTYLYLSLLCFCARACSMRTRAIGHIMFRIVTCASTVQSIVLREFPCLSDVSVQGSSWVSVCYGFMAHDSLSREPDPSPPSILSLRP